MASVRTTASVPHSLVVVHPLVLLSAVDHYHRLLKDVQGKRVVGVLLGSVSKGVVDITNSYAVPFEEDDKNPKIWFFDHNYHETMWAMFRKVNARERVVGWYSTGPKIKQNDLEINEVLRRYTPDPVLVVIDVHMHEVGIPTKAYVSVEEVLEDGTNSRRFQHIPSIIDALEAEEVGVEHLLRDVKDTNISTLATQINDKVLALKSLITRLEDIHRYLKYILDGKLPPNHTIINQIQEIFNLLPNLQQDQLIKAFNVQTNDQSAVIYVASLIRSVIALHNLINNKLDFKAAEEKELDEEKKIEEKKKEEEEEKKKDSGSTATASPESSPATPKQQ